MARRKRTTGEKHQTKTKSGTLAHIRIDGVLHTKHFKRDTDPLDIKKWLLATEVRFRGKKTRRTGKFSDDARIYLEAVKAMPSYSDRKQHIEEWMAVFTDRRRDDISSDEIAAQLARWRTEPRTVTVTRRPTIKAPVTKTLILSASAVNKRRTALQHLFSVLDGKSAANPVKDVPPFSEPSALPLGLPYVVIRQVLAAMQNTPNRARAMVIAYTGIPHKQLKQLTPADVDLAAKTVTVRGRSKGKGTKPWTIPLTEAAVRAFKAMARQDAWGEFSSSSLRKAWRRAYKAVTGRDDSTPYHLRHSFGTEVYRASGDIRATQELMGHSNPRLTHRYTLAAVDARLEAALRGFGRKRR